MRRSNTTIRLGLPPDQAVLVDGVPMDCVSHVEIDMGPGKPPTATLQLVFPEAETVHSEPTPTRHAGSINGQLRCCGRNVSDLPKGQLITWDLDRVTCRGR